MIRTATAGPDSGTSVLLYSLAAVHAKASSLARSERVHATDGVKQTLRVW